MIFLSFSSFFFFCTFILMFKCLECAHFTKYRYSFPFSHNKLSNTDSLEIERSLQFAGKIYCARRLRNRRIVPAEFLSCSLHCFLPRSHTAVLGILLIEYSNVIRLAWLRSPYWCDTATATVVGDSTRSRAIPLAMLTMKKRNARVS